MRGLPTPQLPTPWMPYDTINPLGGLGTPGSKFTSSGWPAANTAIYTPISLPCDAQCYALWARGANTTGNYDLGIYDSSLNLIASKGSTANANAILEFLVDLRLYGGVTYYLAMVASSTSSSIFRWQPGSAARCAIMGYSEQASALPLPSTMVPVDATNDYAPMIALGFR